MSKKIRDSLFEGLDIAKIQRDTARLRDNWTRLDALLPDFVLKYPNQWVGMEGGIIVIALDENELYDKLQEPGTAAVKFLDPNPKKFILFAERELA